MPDKIGWLIYDEEDVFWKGYCEIEQVKSTSSAYSSLTTAENRHWFQRGIEYMLLLCNPSPDAAERKYRMHFLAKTQSVTVFALLFDFCFLAITILYGPVGAMMQGSLSVHADAISLQSRTAWALQNATWCCLIAISLGFYARLHYGRRFGIGFDHGFDEDGNILRALDGIGYAVIAARILIALQVISIFVHHEGTCMELDSLHPADTGFSYILIRMVLDMIQACVISLMPIRRTNLLALCVIEAFTQSTRLLTCSRRLHLDPIFHTWVSSFVSPIIGFYFLAIVVPSITLDRSIAASYQHLLRLKEAADEKKQLVSMFCSDLKVPVQQTKQLLSESQMAINGEQFEGLDGGLSAITLLVDQALFLIRLHEGRFVYHSVEVISLPVLVEEVLIALMHSNSHTQTPGASLSPIDRALFELDIADARLFSNKNCLTILLYYSLSAVLLLGNGNDDREGWKVGMNLSIRGVGDTGHLFGSFYLRQAVKGADSAQCAGSPLSGVSAPQTREALYHYQTCLMFCQHIAKACAGTFSCTLGVMQFSIPCRLYLESMSTHDEVDSKLSPAVIQQTCIYSSDPSLLTFAIDALQAISPNAEAVPVFHQLNMADMHIRSVVVVTSLSACSELRQKGYLDYIVLMTDRLAYLDDKDRMLFDQAVAIPSSPHQLTLLSRWLNAKVIHNTPVPLEHATITITKAVDAQDWVIHSLGLVPRLVVSSSLNYVRWMMLNPSGTLYHHTSTNIVMLLGLILVMGTVYAIQAEVRISSVVVMFPIALFILIRCFKIQRVEKWGKRFFHVMVIINILFMKLGFFQVYLQYFNSYTEGYWQPSPFPRIHSTEQFLNTHYANSTTGKVLIYNVMICTLIAKMLSEFFIWPYNLFAVTAQLAYGAVIVLRYLPIIINRQLVAYLAITLLVVGAFVIGVLIYTENLRRMEFGELREFILSRDFLERAVSACWRDTKAPLTTLTAIQEAMLSGISKEVVERQQEQTEAMLVTTDLLERMEKVNFNVVLSKGLLYEMQMSLRSLSTRNASLLIASMDDHLLRPIIRRICALFLRDDGLLCINFFLRIHPSMLFVRCNKVLLEAMVFGACRSAVERIEHSMKHHAQCAQQEHGGHQRSRGISHEVLVAIFPGPDQAMLRFTDIHMMHIVVMDTAIDHQNTSNKSKSKMPCAGTALQNTRYLFMKNTYERYMRQHGQKHAFYSIAHVQHEHYHHSQRIALPYKLCPATPKVASFLADIVHDKAEKVVKMHLEFQKQYQTEYEERTAMYAAQQLRRNGRASNPPAQLSADLTGYLPFRLLTLLTPKTQLWNGGTAQREFARYADCYDAGWDRKIEYIKPGIYPDLKCIRASYCVVIDYDLVTENAFLNRSYLADLVLYLRAHDFVGIIALAVYSDSDRLDTGKSESASVCSSTSSVGVCELQGCDTVDMEVEPPMDVLKLLSLRMQCDARLMQLALPSV